VAESVSFGANLTNNAMKPYLYVLSLLLLAAGCAPRTLYLTPVADEYGTHEGRRVVRQTHDGLKIVTSFDGRWGDFLVFDTEVSNESDAPIQIRPADFTSQGLDAKWSVVGNGFTKQSLFAAADPDQSVTYATDQLRRAERRQRFNRVFNTVLMLAAVTADVASAASAESRQNPQRYVANRVAFQNTYDVISIKALNDRRQYASDLDRWEHYRWVFQHEPLRRTELAPGDGIRGRVYVPYVAGATFVRLNYPASDTPFTFLFEQRWLKRLRQPEPTPRQPAVPDQM
jgi:hypothetical protein